MRKVTLTGTVVLSLFLITGLVYAEEKFAYVDLAKVFDEYRKTKEYDKILEDKRKGYEKERVDRVEKVKELQEKLSLLSEEERETRKGELEKRIEELQEFDRSTTQDLRKQRDEKVQEIFKDIKDVIDSYAKKQGFILVLDKRALVFYDDSLDITDKISDVLKKK